MVELRSKATARLLLNAARLCIRCAIKVLPSAALQSCLHGTLVVGGTPYRGYLISKIAHGFLTGDVGSSLPGLEVLRDYFTVAQLVIAMLGGLADYGKSTFFCVKLYMF